MKSLQSKSLHMDMTVNEVIQLFPAAVAVFKRFGIDSCCGGALPIREAARRHGKDEKELLAALVLVA